MKANPAWRELFRSDDHQMARNLATCLEAMEFRARLVDPGGFDAVEIEPDETKPLLVQVPDCDWPQLFEIVDELVSEQLEFDEFIIRIEERARRGERRLLIVLIIIVGALAAAGAADL